MNETIDLLLAHRSIRKFKPDPVPPEHIATAIRAGQAASTSSAVQAYHAVLVTEAGARSELAELSGPQPKVADCGAFLVFCGDSRRHAVACERDGVPFEPGMESFLLGVIDATLFAQNACVAFESMGYGICYIGGIRNDLARVGRVLDLPPHVFPLFGLCVGLPDESPSERPRIALGDVLSENSYPSDQRVLAGLTDYDARYREYLTNRGAEPAGWSEKMAAKFSTQAREHVGPWYASQGARYD